MDAEAEDPRLRSILANLSREICGPLDSLRSGIGRFLDHPHRPISGAERLQAQTMLELCDDLAKAFGGNAAVAATRAVVDAGWYPYAAQIGQTGKTVAPKLYLAAGISGAIQHKVGMQSSENIVAINKDANAPIFEFSDLGIVGDLNKILPKLTEAVKARKG